MSKRFSNRRRTDKGDVIDFDFWLIFDSAGGVRLARGTPTCGRAERAISLTATLPAALWLTPQLRATLTVTAPDQPEPTIDLPAVAATLRAATGLDFDLRIQEPGA